MYPEDAEIILKLIAWFIKDEPVAEKLDIDPAKGLMLVGPVGCGKTSLMNICKFLLATDKRHSLKSCREITFEFIKRATKYFIVIQKVRSRRRLFTRRYTVLMT